MLKGAGGWGGGVGGRCPILGAKVAWGGRAWCSPLPASSSPQVGGDRTDSAIPLLDVQGGEGRLCGIDFVALGSWGHCFVGRGQGGTLCPPPSVTMVATS